jgi:hypothetical protein
MVLLGWGMYGTWSSYTCVDIDIDKLICMYTNTNIHTNMDIIYGIVYKQYMANV